MNHIAISPAGPEDKEAVRRVSRACYEDDYVSSGVRSLSTSRR